MKKILVTGSNGQLGNEIRCLSAKYPDFSFLFTDVAELDITNSKAVEIYFKQEKPDFLINCAAYTAVDKAEDDVELCYKINETAVGVLAENAQRYGCRMIHVSTDYVFDGQSYQPYTEDMPVSPSSVYGRSKLAGEQLLLKLLPDSVIVRTSWLYSSFGNNFVKTILRLSRERESLNVIFDQVGTPTFAADLAEALMSIISQDEFHPGVYHFSNEGVCSWYDFALKISRMDGNECDVKPIETKDYPVKTSRPFYSVLNKQKIKKTYNLRIAHWEDGLLRCMKQLKG